MLSKDSQVLSHCNKCKLALPHTIVNMKSKSVIGKVKCRTCQSQQVYKNPSAVKAGRNRSGTRAAKAGASESISDMWLEAVGKSQAKSRPYSLRENFAAGDIIDHPNFGPGVVERLIDADKIQVIFRHEIKTLMHNK